MRVLIGTILYLLSYSSLKGQEIHNPYNLSFKELDSSQIINMVDFQGKKVIIAVINASNPDKSLLLKLDSIYRHNGAAIMPIVIPIQDFGSHISEESLLRFCRDTLQLKMPISQISFGGKSNATHQHPLLRWVTTKEYNQHFDYDIKNGNELFILSETGKLFAVLKNTNGSNGSLINKLLTVNAN